MLHCTCSSCLGWVGSCLFGKCWAGLLREWVGSGYVQQIGPMSISELAPTPHPYPNLLSELLPLPKRCFADDELDCSLQPVDFVTLTRVTNNASSSWVILFRSVQFVWCEQSLTLITQTQLAERLRSSSFCGCQPTGREHIWLNEQYRSRLSQSSTRNYHLFITPVGST